MRLFSKKDCISKALKSLFILTLFYASNLFGQTEPPRMYHDFVIDHLAENIKFLATTETYENDKKLQDIASKLPNKLDRYNAKDYEAALSYIVNDFELTEETITMYYSPFSFTKQLSNLRHIATHALADIYFEAENYSKAVEFYKKAMLEHLPVGTSGTTINKDYLRMEYDLSELYFNQKNYELAVLHLLHNEMNGQTYGDYLSKKLTEYSEFIDAKKFLPKLDAMLTTLETDSDYFFKYKFDGKAMRFSPFMSNPASCKAKVINTEFYKNLKKRAPSSTFKKPEMPAKTTLSFKIDDTIFYHHDDINSFIRGLLIIKERETYKEDDTFQTAVDNCLAYLERKDFDMAIDELNYIVDNSFYVESILEKLDADQIEDVKHLPHLAAHYKFDMLMNNKNYPIAMGALQYMKSVPNFMLTSKNNKEIKLEKEELLFKEAFANNGLAASEYGLLHLLGALINCPSYEVEINQLMNETAQKLGKDRVIKFLTQVESNLSKGYESTLKLSSPPFNIDIPNLHELQPNQIRSRINDSQFYKTYMD